MRRRGFRCPEVGESGGDFRQRNGVKRGVIQAETPGDPLHIPLNIYVAAGFKSAQPTNAEEVVRDTGFEPVTPTVSRERFTEREAFSPPLTATKKLLHSARTAILGLCLGWPRRVPIS